MGRLTTRTVALVLAVGLLAGGAAFATGALSETDTPTERTGVAADAAVANHSAGGSIADRLACTNGTSEAVVACGYNPGPTAVSLSDQETENGSVTVDAVELAEGGFVAVHRATFVDGAFTESVVGVSRSLDAGLHRDVEVDLENGVAGEQRLIAVVYRDSDGDDTFDFVATDGADDRPYTNTYSERAGNVTDEAGDVIGDVATVESEPAGNAPVVVPGGPPATDTDGDGRFEDANGDGNVTPADVTYLFRNRNNAGVENNPTAFDFNGDGSFDPADVTRLFNSLL